MSLFSVNVAPLMELVILVEPECMEQAVAPGAHLAEILVLFPLFPASSRQSPLPCQAATSARCPLREAHGLSTGAEPSFQK